MRIGRAFALVTLVVAACVGGTEEDRRASIDELIDVEAELPDDVTGVDLGELTPPDSIGFCEASARAPARWLTDAVFPLQYWLDTFGAVEDVPDAARAPLDDLLAFGRERMAWQLGRRDARPDLSVDLAGDAIDLFEIALDRCSGLPMVIGRPEAVERPAGWADLTDEEIALRCADLLDGLAADIDEYVALVGERPRHHQQLELESTRALLLAPETAPLMFASDFVGIGPDGAPVPVPGGACDL